MRDPKRITRVLALIEAIWQSAPDLRFFQLVNVLEHEYSKRNLEYGKTILLKEEATATPRTLLMPHAVIELFHLEDDLFEEFLEDFQKERRTPVNSEK